MWWKIKLYILSLGFLFVLILANQLPYCLGSNCSFVGWSELLFTKPYIILFCFLGVLVSIAIFYNFRYVFVKGATLPAEKIIKIESLNFENLTFLATYIIPLVCFDLDFHLKEERNFVMLILVLCLIGWIYVKTNIFYTNPTLAVLNFKIYRVSTLERNDIVIITKDALELGQMILPNKIDDQIFFASRYPRT